MQGGWIHKDAYQQLPYFDAIMCGKMKQKLNGKTLFNYAMMAPEERRELVTDVFAGRSDIETIFS